MSLFWVVLLTSVVLAADDAGDLFNAESVEALMEDAFIDASTENDLADNGDKLLSSRRSHIQSRHLLNQPS